MALVHEFGHLLGAKDHYGVKDKTTEAVNDYLEESLGTNQACFSSNCIYGENKDSIAPTLCDGCRRVVIGDMDFPVF